MTTQICPEMQVNEMRAFYDEHHKVSSFLKCHQNMDNRPRSIYQYSNMGPRLSGLTSIFGVVFFVSKSPLGIEGQKKL